MEIDETAIFERKPARLIFNTHEFLGSYLRTKDIFLLMVKTIK